MARVRNWNDLHISKEYAVPGTNTTGNWFAVVDSAEGVASSTLTQMRNYSSCRVIDPEIVILPY